MAWTGSEWLARQFLQMASASRLHNQPLLGSDDWRGITFGTNKSQGQADAIRALGDPGGHFRRSRNEAPHRRQPQGFEMNLRLYETSVIPQAAPYISANVNLWPHLDVLLANPERLAQYPISSEGLVGAGGSGRREQPVGAPCRRPEGVRSPARGAHSPPTKEDLRAARRGRACLPRHGGRRPNQGIHSSDQELKQSTLADEPLAILAGCGGKAPACRCKSVTASAELNGTYHTLTKRTPAGSTILKRPVPPTPIPVTLQTARWQAAASAKTGATGHW